MIIGRKRPTVKRLVGRGEHPPTALGEPLGERTHTTRRLRSSLLQRLERDHLAHTQLQRICHRLQALN